MHESGLPGVMQVERKIPHVAARSIEKDHRDGTAGSWPFSTSSQAPATILVSSPVVVLSQLLLHQPDLTKADPSISWSSCTHAAAAAQ